MSDIWGFRIGSQDSEESRESSGKGLGGRDGSRQQVGLLREKGPTEVPIDEGLKYMNAVLLYFLPWAAIIPPFLMSYSEKHVI